MSSRGACCGPTQFHEFAEQVLHFVRVGPVSVVPRMTSQPVAAREVAEALVDLVEAGPSGRVPDLAGPEVLPMHRLARRVSRARGPGAGRGRRTRARRGGARHARRVADPARAAARPGGRRFDEWLRA